MIAKDYLGDAVYAEISQFGELILTTEDGISVSNRIALDDSTLTALERFVQRARDEALAAQSENREAQI